MLGATAIIAAVDAYPADLSPQQAAAELRLGWYAGLTDSERIVGNLHRAYAELDGLERGSPLDDARRFADMVAFNGGAPLRCLALTGGSAEGVGTDGVAFDGAGEIYPGLDVQLVEDMT